MCIINKVFYYEETKLPLIRYKDEVWVKANTVANILGYKNTKRSIRDHVDPEDKSKLSELDPSSKENELLPLDLGFQSKGNESFCLKRNEKTAIYINGSGLYSLILCSKL